MFKTRWLSSAVIFSALLGISISLVSCAGPHPVDHPAEVMEISGPTSLIKISAFPEKDGGVVSGQYYRFESLPQGGKDWVMAMQFRHDDPVAIPKQNVRFVTAKTAFVFMGWKYAVTTDSGKQWSVWSAEKDLPGWQCCNYSLINGVALSQSGKGEMTLVPIQGRAGEVPRLFTSDFGRHWVAHPPHN
jgi:hypothetical protein